MYMAQGLPLQQAGYSAWGKKKRLVAFKKALL
jgi:hypothetical protein